MDRRTFIATAAASPLAATTAGATAPDPIIALHKQYVKAKHAFETSPEAFADTEEDEALYRKSFIENIGPSQRKYTQPPRRP